MSNNKINKLSNIIINKISINETINSVSCILKELFENSIDANSKKIFLFLEDFGIDLIKIIDDGDGIYKNDLLNLFKKYYSSKIKTLNDLNKIKTYGFRGQALFSIYNFCDITVTSKPKDQELAWQINNLKELKPFFCLNGTIIEITNLKLLNNYKTKNDIFADIFNSFKLIALSNFDIHFIIFKNGIEYKNLSPCFDNYSKINRIKNLFDNINFSNLFDIKFNNTIYNFSGFLLFSKKKINNFKFFFVNKYSVIDEFFKNILDDVFNKYIKKSFNVSYCFYLDVDYNFIDINFNSKKQFIKFKSDDVYSFIFNGISSYFINKYKSFNINLEKNKNINLLKLDYILLNSELLNKNLFFSENKILAFLNNLFIIFYLNNNLFFVKLTDIRFKIMLDKACYQFKKFSSLEKKDIIFHKCFFFNNNLNLYKINFLNYGFIFEKFYDDIYVIKSVPDLLYDFYVNWNELVNDLLNYFEKNKIISINKFDIYILNIFIKHLSKNCQLYEFENFIIYKKLIELQNVDKKWFSFYCKKISFNKKKC